MQIAFVIIAILTLGSAIAALSLRNLVHCALCMVMTFVGIAATFLMLNAEFVGFAQMLVYVGAVAILIVFAVLLTRRDDAGPPRLASTSWLIGFAVAALVGGALIFAILQSPANLAIPASEPQVTVKKIGEQLMTTYLLPLEVMGLLLTAALVGAVVISMRENGEAPSEPTKNLASSSEKSGDVRSTETRLNSTTATHEK